MIEKRKYNAFDLIRLAFKVSSFWSTVLLIQRVIGALMPALSVLVAAYFIDTALAVVSDGLPTNALFLPMLGLGAIIAYQWGMRDVQKYIDSKLLITTRNKYQLQIIEKRARLAYRHIEDQDTYNLIKRVADPSESQIIKQYNETLDLFSTIVNVVSIMAILLANVWWVALVILAISTPLFFLGVKAGKASYQADRDVSKIKRKATYLADVCSGREAVDERSLFGYSQKMMEMFWERFESARVYQQKVDKKNFIQMKIGGIGTALFSTFAMIVLLFPLAAGLITIGLFMSLINACANLTSVLSWQLSHQLNQLAKNREYLKDLDQFCALDEIPDALVPRKKTIPIFESLEFKNVSFTYPDTIKPILSNVSFVITGDKHYAFVGENGAGKTTIIKLLTGQYANYDGEILINGKNLKAYSFTELKSFFSIAYQDFAKYALSVEENLMIGDLYQSNSDSLQSVLKDLNLDTVVDNLTQGLKTSLGKIKAEGVDLSGGQWQRLALARTLINPAPIKILDEPTAALDPLSESQLYHQFEKLIHGRTSIFISHRLGSIKLADEIFVFKDGKLIELGTHEDLMAKATYYAQMYSSQLNWYQGEEDESA